MSSRPASVIHKDALKSAIRFEARFKESMKILSGVTQMTNYNDGKWHFYQGNSNPVHSKSKIDIKCVNYMGEIVECTRHAGVHVWSTPTLFRVVKEYKEPREFWLCEGKVFYDRDSAYRSCSSAGYIRVREVED